MRSLPRILGIRTPYRQINFVNGVPITWYSNKQNTVETSALGSEFVALRIAVDLIEALRLQNVYVSNPIEGATKGMLVAYLERKKDRSYFLYSSYAYSINYSSKSFI